MARPGLLTHRKFVRLARLLKSDALAVGHLEIIWQACYESGDPVLGNSDDVEYLARWKGDAGMLTSALVESGFLDDDGGRFSVHDLFDHAPDYVQRRMEREEDRRRKGVTLSELRAKAGRASGLARRKQAGTTDEHVLNTCLNKREQTGTNGATPAPAPAPAHHHPPRPPSATPDGDEDEILAAVKGLRSKPYGINRADRLVRAALARGVTLLEIQAISAEWLARGKWSSAQLHERIAEAIHGEPASGNWPPPDKSNGQVKRPVGTGDPETDRINEEFKARQAAKGAAK